MSKNVKKHQKTGKKSLFLLVFTLIIIICAGIGGFIGCSFLTKDDGCFLLGEKIVTVYKGEEYSDNGIEVIEFGRKVSQDKIKVESNVDTSKLGDYDVIYTVESFRFKGKTLSRQVKVIDKVVDPDEPEIPVDPDEPDKPVDPEKPGEGEIISSGELSIHFLELGNQYTGDCIYIKYGDVDILIDAGSRQNSAPTIISYLENYVEDNTLEYVIATHGHQDHIAAFCSTNNTMGIFERFDTEVIIDFPKTDSTSKILQSYYSYRDIEVENGAKHYTALECYNNQNGGQRTYQIGEGVQLEILYNYYYENKTSDENDYSVCVMINQDNNHYLFTGDLEKKGEEKLVEFYETKGGLPHCTLYKAGHHGSGTSSSQKLLEKISPDYVCICTCAGSDEYTQNKDNQFPTQVFVNNIAPYTDKIYVTSMADEKQNIISMNGNIVFYSNKGKFSIKCSNNDTILKDTKWFEDNRTMPNEWIA